MSSNLSKTTRAESAVGARLIEAYERRGITSKQVISQKLGFKSTNAIYKVLSGDRELSFDALRRFAQDTGVSINFLLTGEEEEKTQPAHPPRRKTKEELVDELKRATDISPRLKTLFPSKSTEEIAVLLGIPEADVVSYFNGRLPAADVLMKIAHLTGVSLTWLLTNKGPQWAAPSADNGGETERVAEDNGSLPRMEAVGLSPEKGGTEDRVLTAYMQLLVAQNAQIVEQNTRIIQLLGEIAQKVG